MYKNIYDACSFVTPSQGKKQNTTNTLEDSRMTVQNYHHTLLFCCGNNHQSNKQDTYFSCFLATLYVVLKYLGISYK